MTLATKTTTSSQAQSAHYYSAAVSATLECNFCGADLSDANDIAVNEAGRAFCSADCCVDGALWDLIELEFAKREHTGVG